MMWMLGDGWRRVSTTVAIVITSVIFLPIHLASQTSGTSNNLPLALASGEQYAPALVSDGQAGAFVIWHDKRESRAAIYAQHLNPLSQPTWKQDGILVAASAKEQLALSAVADGKNGVLIFWQDLRNDTGDIYGQRIDANGNLLWGTAGVEVIRATGKQSEPQAVSDGEGGAFVVWHDFKSGSEDIAVQGLDGNGKILFEPAGRSVAQGLGNQTLGEVAATNDGGFVAVWSDNNAGFSRVAVQRFDAKANPQWPTNGSVTTIRSTPIAPVIYHDGRENTFVVWSDNHNSDLFAQKIDLGGSPQWGLLGVTICKASNDQANPQIVSDGSDGIFVAWEDKRSGKMDIYAQAVNAAGQTRWQTDGVIIITASQEQTQPRLVADGSGGLICVWTDERNSGTNIAAQRLDKTGKALWEANGIFITPDGGIKQRPAILSLPGDFLGPNGSFVVWEDSRRGNEDIFAQALKGDGTLANVPPLITSSPVTEAQAGLLYNYQVKALDYDSTDPLRLELVTPTGSWLQIDNAKLKLSGTPSASDAGEVAVTIAVQDKPGAQATQSFTIKVINNNHPPQITSKPDTVATEDQPYIYQIVASDPDPGDALTYSLQTEASWLKLDNARKLSGTPRNDDVGSYEVTLQVTDKLGLASTQTFSLQVKNVNDPPIITSRPDTVTSEDRLYSYQIVATDPDAGDALTYTLQTDATWLKLDNDGKLSGTPTNENVGSYTVTLRAVDQQNVSTSQKFSLRVKNVNDPPIFTSQPDTAATEDQLYSYKFAATDPDVGDALKYSLQTDAAWLKLTNDGKLTGTPTNDNVGSYTVILRATDKQNASTAQTFSLRVKNVNDPPFFTSQPDMVALADSLYIYRATAADVDRGDVVQILKRAAPEWLSWNTNTRTLQGKPNSQQAGAIYPVSLLARDAAGASVEQSFRLRVVTTAPPDVTAPSAPQALQIEPAQWSANKKFTLHWQNPFDPSRITGAYYKIGAPPTHNQDGIFVPSPDGVTIDQLELLAAQEGKTPVYLWLVDGRGNVDFRNVTTVNYRYDATPPAAPQNLSPNRQWSRGDSLLLQWTPSTDVTSGIRRYHFFLDGKFFGFINGDADKFTLILQLNESTHNWTFMPEDSAGNAGQSVGASFKVDHTPPTLQHNGVDTTIASSDLVLPVHADDALSQIRNIQIYYRAAGESTYHSKSLQATSTPSSFTVRLAAAEVPAKGLEYFLEAADSAGNRTRWPAGAPANFHAVVMRSTTVAAPAPFIAKRYQLFSVPYRLLDGSAAQLLEDDLGRYDPTVWRLFGYQPGEGNVEFGKPNFENFAPGRAFWLITTKPQNFDAGPVHSMRTDAPFELTLQPGWNLIATPFDFPTAWSAVQKPESVEDNLWAFEGTKYLDQQPSLLPWQGYFLRNLDSQPQTISIAPIAGKQANKSQTLSTEVNWQVQLLVADGEFSDEANYLGVAERAVETWDPLDLSEPPTIGDHVSLYFDHRDWSRFGGAFTRDFRPAGDAAQQWPFTVITSRPGVPVKLSWNFSGDLPDDWVFVLQDVEGGLRRQIRPDELHRGESYVFRATAQPRHFVWWAGKAEPLAEAGALQDLVPAAYELAPSYPNPLRLAESPNVGVIRFGLPDASTIRLTIFDLAGRTVRTLVDNRSFDAGYNEVNWNGRDNAGRAVTAGVYIYRLETAHFSASRKLILLR